MDDSICITLTLNRIEACQLLEGIRLLHAAEFKKHWDDDLFRSIPIEERHLSLLSVVPAMSAQKRLIVALAQCIWGTAVS